MWGGGRGLSVDTYVCWSGVEGWRDGVVKGGRKADLVVGMWGHEGFWDR